MIKAPFPDRLPTLADTLLILGGLVRGTWFLLPGQVFDTTPAYAMLEHINPDENVWGWVFIGLGILAILAVKHGHHRRRWIIALTLMVLWLYIGVLFFLANPYGAGWQQFVYLAIPAFWNLTHINDRRLS